MTTNPDHLYPDAPEHEPQTADMWFQILPNNRKGVVHFETVEDTLAFASFPAFSEQVFRNAWKKMYGLICPDEVCAHYRASEAIAARCNHLIETRRLDTGMPLKIALKMAMGPLLSGQQRQQVRKGLQRPKKR